MGDHLYTRNIVSILLLPLSALYWCLYTLHKLFYRVGILEVRRVDVPVIVIGNITVGGTGKTPLVIWVSNFLRSHGYHPGIVSRGYKGKSSNPGRVSPESDPGIVGDEPALLAGRTGVPVYTGARRVDAAKQLLSENRCDVLISDDGLQHYSLHRDIEVAVIDGWRRYGNEFFLPAGPLRESKKRLTSVDWVLCRGGEARPGEINYDYEITGIRDLKSQELHDLDHLAGKKVHAIAGLGNPEQFFKSLEALGCNVERHPFPDHYGFTEADLDFSDNVPIIMTEKDAVKCRQLADKIEGDIMYTVIDAKLPDTFGAELLDRLSEANRHG